ncbi:MAG: hypothetical protein WCY86_10685 [Spirosomataceae bacterium]
MSEKVTQDHLKKYATEFCAITLTKAYREKNTLNGHELLKLTPVRKINQHIVSRLSAHWNSQLRNFNSPYFDFEAPEVKQALEHFSNVVSQHIALRREHLQPWLQDVVEKTLAPLADKSELSEADEELVRQFSQTHPLVLDLPKSEPGPKSVSFFNLVEEDEPEITEIPVETKPIEEPQTPPPSRTERIPESINTRYGIAASQVTADPYYGSVRLKLENIGQSISLAQRFMFVGQLFKGDFEAFSQSIQVLDNSPDWETAQSYIYKSLVERYDWDIKSEVVTELVNLVKRKFL